MISQSIHKIKSGNSLHQRKNKVNCRSLSLIDNNKIYQNQNINMRFKTQSQQLKTQKHNKSLSKFSLLLNSFQQSKIKSVKTKRYDQIQSPTQKYIPQLQFQEQTKIDRKTQNQWVNSVLPTMTAQALHQQNLQLKKQNNFLKQQNSKLSSKLVLQKKQKQKLANQLSLENEHFNLNQRLDLFDSKAFDKVKSMTKGKVNNQFHPVNYMITGIKFRYQKLKNDYELKCKHVQEIMKLTNYTQIQQILKENSVLKKQNEKMLQKIIELESKYLIFQKPKNQIVYNAENCQRKQKFRNFTESSPKNLTNLIQSENQLQKVNKKLNQQNATLQKKIESLEGQLLQKVSVTRNVYKSMTLIDNQLYYKKKENSKLKKIQKQIEVKLLSLENQNVNIKKQCQLEILNVKKVNQQIFYKEKQIFLKQIEEKNEKITKLEKQISYLSTLLKYWRPLQKDQKSSIQPQSSSKIDNQEFQESANLRASLLLVSNRKRTKTKISQNDKSIEDFKLNLKEPVLSLKPSEFQGVLIGSSDDQPNHISLRIPKTSRQKHSEKGFKARKVNPLEIEYMKEQLRYRCMARRLTMDQIRNYFNFNEQKHQNLRKSEHLWKEKYTTMKQIQKILIDTPFITTADEAYKLSRFIVEDTSAQHVFCDEDNQIERDIVKSIIQAFIGDYQLPDIQNCKIQLQTILKNYGVNLKKALDALCQNQIVSPKKLFELMQSLGIQVSLQLRNEMICRLYEKNDNRDLNCLRYQMIFQPQFL